MIFQAAHSPDPKEANNIQNGTLIVEEFRDIVRQWRSYAVRVKVPEALGAIIEGNLVGLRQ